MRILTIALSRGIFCKLFHEKEKQMVSRPWQTRLIALLKDELPLSKGERTFYIRGAETMSEKDAKMTCEKLEHALDTAEDAVKVAGEMLRKRQKRHPM